MSSSASHSDIWHLVAKQMSSLHGRKLNQLRACRAELRTISSISCDSYHVASAELYHNLYFNSPASLINLSAISKDPGRAHIPARIARVTTSITLGFRLCTQPSAELASLVDGITHLLTLAKRLQSFTCVASQMSVLPESILRALATHNSETLETLHGFALPFQALGTADFLGSLAGFEQLKTLTTGPTWRPADQEEEDEITPVLLQQGGRPMFQHLHSLSTPLIQGFNPLFGLLMEVELPQLQSLRVFSWERNSILAFLEKHGRGLTHLDIKYSSTHHILVHKLVDPAIESIPFLLQVLQLCPNLTHLTLHQDKALEVISNAPHDWTHPSLQTIHMGSAPEISSWTFPEHQERPISSPFADDRALPATTATLDAGDWRRPFPRLAEFTVYHPSEAEEASRTRGQLPFDAGKQLAEQTATDMCGYWARILRGKGIDLRMVGDGEAGN